MPATEPITYSSPVILDDVMNLDDYTDQYESHFFDSSLPYEASGASPGNILSDDLFDADRSPALLASPKGTPIKFQVTKGDTAGRLRQPAPSLSSSDSPPGSFRDSSSDRSVYNRNSTSTSPPSSTVGKDAVSTGMDLGQWPNDELMGGTDAEQYFGGTIDPSSMTTDYDFNDKTMENDFDFESAASSPSPFNTTAATMNSPDMPTIKHEAPSRDSPKLKNRYQHAARASVSTL